jgi:dephospho-CoA kinase
MTDVCDCCGESVRSWYYFTHEVVDYSGHKRCMGAPMIRKLTEVSVKNPPNIAICGLIRSGKDAVGAYLTERYGYTRFAFGDGIRRITRELYPESYADGNVKPRALLQGFGQMARSFDENVWVNDCFRRIAEKEAWLSSRKVAPIIADVFTLKSVITDLRQPSEYDRCRAEGYVIIRVKAPESLRIHRAIESADTFNLRDLTHETESYVDSFAVDYEVDNSGSLAELYAQIDLIMWEITEGTQTPPLEDVYDVTNRLFRGEDV